MVLIRCWTWLSTDWIWPENGHGLAASHKIRFLQFTKRVTVLIQLFYFKAGWTKINSENFEVWSKGDSQHVIKIPPFWEG